MCSPGVQRGFQGCRMLGNDLGGVNYKSRSVFHYLPNSRKSVYGMDLLATPRSRCSPAWALSKATWRRQKSDSTGKAEDGVLSWCCLIWCLPRSGRSTDKVLFRVRKYQCMLTLRSEQTKWEAVFNYKQGLWVIWVLRKWSDSVFSYKVPVKAKSELPCNSELLSNLSSLEIIRFYIQLLGTSKGKIKIVL